MNNGLSSNLNTQPQSQLADVISDNESDDSGRDDNKIYDGIKAIDFTQTENQINEVLAKHLHYKLTDIKLIL